MSLSRKRLFPLLALLGTTLHAAEPGHQVAASLDQKIHRKVPTYELRADNTIEALARVARDFQIPMGIEFVDNANARRSVSLSWRDTTPGEILNAIISHQNLHWVPDGDVVRVSSVLISDKENPLKVRISEFVVRNVTTETAERQLHEALRRTISPPIPQQGGSGGVAGSGASNADDPKISLQSKDMTVEDILDKLVSVSARKIWIATFSDSPSLTTTGFRRSPSDDQQPVWILLHWWDEITPNIRL